MLQLLLLLLMLLLLLLLSIELVQHGLGHRARRGEVGRAVRNDRGGDRGLVLRYLLVKRGRCHLACHIGHWATSVLLRAAHARHVHVAASTVLVRRQTGVALIVIVASQFIVLLVLVVFGF